MKAWSECHFRRLCDGFDGVLHISEGLCKLSPADSLSGCGTLKDSVSLRIERDPMTRGVHRGHWPYTIVDLSRSANLGSFCQTNMTARPDPTSDHVSGGTFTLKHAICLNSLRLNDKRYVLRKLRTRRFDPEAAVTTFDSLVLDGQDRSTVLYVNDSILTLSFSA